MIFEPGKSATLFDGWSPTSEIPVVCKTKCPRQLLEMCCVPNEARRYLPNMTKVEIVSESFYVRGVSSCFFEVETEDKTRYYVHENLVRST